VIQDGSGLNFWRNSTTNTWQPTMPNPGLYTVEPGQAYWIQNRNHANDDWVYDYDASGNSLIVSPNPRQNDNSGTAKITPSVTKVKTGKSLE
jgi:hypothetical protein